MLFVFFSCAGRNMLILCHAFARGYGGMVDAEDLKSFGHCDRVGSSPTIPTTLCQGFVWRAIKQD